MELSDTDTHIPKECGKTRRVLHFTSRKGGQSDSERCSLSTRKAGSSCHLLICLFLAELGLVPRGPVAGALGPSRLSVMERGAAGAADFGSLRLTALERRLAVWVTAPVALWHVGSSPIRDQTRLHLERQALHSLDLQEARKLTLLITSWGCVLWGARLGFTGQHPENSSFPAKYFNPIATGVVVARTII